MKWKAGELKVGDKVYSNDHPSIHGVIEELLIKNGETYAIKMMNGVIVEESLLSLVSNPDPEVLHGVKFTLKGQHQSWINYVDNLNKWIILQNFDSIKRYKGSIPLFDTFYYGTEQIIFDSYRQDDPSIELMFHLIFQAGERCGENRISERVRAKLGLY